MRVLYLDPFSGVAGDMLAGSLLDLGVPLEVMQSAVDRLGWQPAPRLTIQRRKKCAVEGVAFGLEEGGDRTPHLTYPPGSDQEAGPASCVHDPHSHHEDVPHRSWKDIRQMLQQSALTPGVQQRALAVFERIARAEARIHGLELDQVHFHEVGAVDSIVDIVAVCAAIDWLKVDAVWSGPLVDGQGWVQCAHGRYPVPVPAVLEILQGIPLRRDQVPFELITPTGAALVAEWVTRWAPLEPLQMERLGYGTGTRDLPDRPNVLRVALGRVECPSASAPGTQGDQVEELVFQVDDMTGEELADLSQRLFEAGALDVWMVAGMMKKGRPAFRVEVLAQAHMVAPCEEVIARASSTFGWRRRMVPRCILRREVLEVSTPWGPVPVKCGWWGERLVRVHPEPDVCQSLARRHGLSLAEVSQAAAHQARHLTPRT